MLSNRTVVSAARALAMLPALFISHGGGPSFFLEDAKEEDSPFWAIGPASPLAGFFRKMPTTFPKPSSVLLISAHWESEAAPVPLPTHTASTGSGSTGSPAAKGGKVVPLAVTSAAKPPLYYDYYGFPKTTYAPYLTYPAPGDPALAAKVLDLLNTAGIPAQPDDTRGFDHGMFVPMKVIWPEADIPTVQLSLHPSLDPAYHLAIGAALAPLRAQGVLILASGFATHNMREMQMGMAGRAPSQPVPWAKQFVDWVTDTVTSPALSSAERYDRLTRVASLAPNFRKAHPREEHFIPLLVAAGAAMGPQASEAGGAAAAAVDAATGEAAATAAAAAPPAVAAAAAAAAEGEAAPGVPAGKLIHSGWALGTGSLACYRFD